jgi:hypothetical protein
MLKTIVSYNKGLKLWTATVHDEIGQLGDAEFHAEHDWALFSLGVEYGRNPHKFSRDIGEYMPAYEAELAATK